MSKIVENILKYTFKQMHVNFIYKDKDYWKNIRVR
jgi:hypothetical protein